LATRCKDRGLPQITASLITDIELGRRRTVGVDEWIQLAAALDVAPVNLLIPLDSAEQCSLGEKGRYPANSVRQWVRGAKPLDFTNSRVYFTQVPEEEWAEFAEQATTKAGIRSRSDLAGEDNAEKIAPQKRNTRPRTGRIKEGDQL
jgi:hypothetical protein